VVPIADIFGSSYVQRAHGIRREGTKAKPTGDPPGSSPPTTTDFTDGYIIGVFRSGDDGEYKLITMYPIPKD
jgi:hypothetical protein